jgi:hypothetical protein
MEKGAAVKVRVRRGVAGSRRFEWRDGIKLLGLANMKPAQRDAATEPKLHSGPCLPTLALGVECIALIGCTWNGDRWSRSPSVALQKFNAALTPPSPVTTESIA